MKCIEYIIYTLLSNEKINTMCPEMRISLLKKMFWKMIQKLYELKYSQRKISFLCIWSLFLPILDLSMGDSIYSGVEDWVYKSQIFQDS